jgi:hypothetical protein
MTIPDGLPDVSISKTLAVVGMSEEEAAHLRLLMRSCARELEHGWRWGDETGADLLIVDTDSFGGQMARTRARGAGVRCAVFSDRPVEDADLLLRRPLLRANVVEVLNQAGLGQVMHAGVDSHGTDFYTRDIGDARQHGDPPADADALPESGLDEALRPRPVELRGDEGTTAAADADARRDAPPAAAARQYTSLASQLADTEPHGLRAWLEEGLLRGPARITIGKAPSLVLDPKNKVAHATTGLRALEPYCHARWPLRDWQPLTTPELAEVRESTQSHSYARLLWLHVLVHSGGNLASHLDPGGSYRLKHWIEIDKDFAKHFRIASAMLQPMRLHEIAASSEASMADVFDFVNAGDAIGLIEWTPRVRRDEAVPAPTSFLGRLRRPFGKS